MKSSTHKTSWQDEKSVRKPDVSRSYKKLKSLRYKVLIYDTFQAAYNNTEAIAQEAKGCDQLNLSIRAEGNMEDDRLLKISPKIKLFAGKAWTVIHERRIEEGWYETTNDTPGD